MNPLAEAAEAQRLAIERLRLMRAPRTSWCWWCRQAVLHGDDDARLVLVDGRDEWICGRCWLRADVGPDVPLTYEEQEGADCG